ncbi:MAG: TonB-dependent receptor [Acidobacteria bacterium]|nr:TonB-dependent receptor [Acidobacteriota bacterium]
MVFSFGLLAMAVLQLSVTDESVSPVEASGTLQSVAVRRAFRTARDGKAELRDLPAGRYRLSVSRDGFAAHSEIVELGEGAPVSRAIVLRVGATSQSVNVVSVTPLAGLNRDLNEIPAPAQTATAKDMAGTLDLSNYLSQSLQSVYINEVQGNPMQADLNYRGYTASPLLGTPQGLSIYMDGVRLNQPFGDVVSWDLLPKLVIAEVAVVPGSNPLFGLNTLGGAISMRTKDGADHAGTSLTLTGGAFGRKMADFEHGGAAANGWNWYTGNSLFFEDGWRESSPSNVRQFFGKAGKGSVNLSLAYANNALIGNGLQEQKFLERDYSSVYTKPDVTANRSLFSNLSINRTLTPKLLFNANAYFRYIRTRTLNGDLNDDSLDQSVYQPNAAEQRALTQAGYRGFPTAGATAANTPFPFWRCLANVLLVDEPAEKCNGLLNRTASQQRNFGFGAQLSRYSARHQFTAGGAYDGNSVNFVQSSELGFLNPDKTISGTGAFGDGVTGGEEDGEPYDTRVNLSGRIHSGGAYATDTIRWGAANITLSGRFNHTTVDNRDRIRPAAGTGSLTGRHSFNRFNPAIGATRRLGGGVTLYGGYTEGNRAPTSIELGCADPETPCRLPNALAGDPPLRQVVTKTYEFGVRGSAERGTQWSAGYFHAANYDDILFVASEQTGFGYFSNFGKTLRRGVEINARTRAGRATFGGGYTFLDATYQSEQEVNGASNSTNGDEIIEIEAGDRIPLIPRNLLKAFVEVQATRRLRLSAHTFAASSSLARGNENGLHQPNGRTFIGPGSSPGYGVVNATAEYQLGRVQLFVQANNLLDRRYYTGAQLGATGFAPNGNFLARPLPAVNGEFPLIHATFFAPGAPRAAWAGIRLKF